MKVAKSIGLLYKLNRSFLKLFLKRYVLHLSIHTYYMVQRLGMEPVKMIPLKLVLQKKAIRAINNLAYNEHTNAYFKCNKMLKLSDQCKLQVSNYIFQVLHSNIEIEIESSLLINNQIHSHSTRTINQMSILRVNRSKQNIVSFTMV